MKPNPEIMPHGPERTSKVDPVSVFIAYDHPDSARRAMQLTQRLASQLSDSVDIRPNLWRIDLLSAPGGYQAALRWASNTDILLVAIRNSLDLPESVCSWLSEALLQRGHQRTALVALFDGANQPGATILPALERLTNLAKDTGADLFSMPNQSPANARWLPGTQWMLHSAHPGAYRWGINE